VTVIVTADPDHGQVTVVEVSPEAVLAVQPALPELKTTAGRPGDTKTTVSATPEAPVPAA
jgi:hypothetical protein